RVVNPLGYFAARKEGRRVLARRRFALRTPAAARLLLAFPREIVDLVRVHVQHDLTAPRILVLDDQLRGVLLANLLTGEIAHEDCLTGQRGLLVCVEWKRC